MKETDTHIFFLKNYLSQWHHSPFFDENGIRYSCAEQYMMAEKAKYFSDTSTYKLIMAAKTPREQKDLGRKVTPFDPDGWSAVCRTVVFKANLFKFTQHDSLKTKLAATGSKVLVEANPVDPIWGVGLGEDDPLILNQNNWRGMNWLGQAIMRVRELITLSSD